MMLKVSVTLKVRRSEDPCGWAFIPSTRGGVLSTSKCSESFSDVRAWPEGFEAASLATMRKT